VTGISAEWRQVTSLFFVDKYISFEYNADSFVNEVIVVSAADMIKKLIETHDGIVHTSDVVAAGLSRTTLAKLTREGALVRVARGQYVLPDELPDELFLWQKRMPILIYSHETALFLHGMAERTPSRHTATLPSNVRLSPTFPGDVKVYMIKPELFEVGLISLPTKMSHSVRAYDTERTVCDILRSRNKIDDQTVVAAMKNYAIRTDKDMNKLGQYAAMFRVTKILRRYLEVLL
jgi:predicted transcriptional regulator of viral defense system